MNGISEILKSGVAPAARCGQQAVDPNSVMAKAPKALRELEAGTGRNRPISAKEISKSFGMPLDFIKKTYLKKNARAFGCILFAFILAVQGAFAGNDITRGITLQNGQLVTASQLHQLVDNAVINPTFITLKPIDLFPLTSDYMVVSSSGTLYKMTIQSLLFGNTNILQSLAQSISSSLLVSNLQFAVLSNGIPIGFVLPAYSPAQPSPYNVSNNLEFMTWDTNGVPYQISFSNLLYSLGYAMNTNFDLPYRFQQMFTPWTLYGTNTANFTNAWGTLTNFPITSYLLTNAYNPTNPTPTITDTDTIPIYANGQRTNTTTTVVALAQAFTNYFPQYAPLARIQFNGNPSTFQIFTNGINATFNSILVTNTANTTSYFLSNNIYAVNFTTNWVLGTNTAFYFVPFVTNQSWGRLYTNYSQAVAQVGWSTIPAVTITNQPFTDMISLTNYTANNADVIQRTVTPNGAILQGQYYVWFRNGFLTTNYYVMGSTMNAASGANNFTIFNLQSPPSQFTNNCLININNMNGSANSTLIQTIFWPQ